jgi:hypothetical protein
MEQEILSWFITFVLQTYLDWLLYRAEEIVDDEIKSSYLTMRTDRKLFQIIDRKNTYVFSDWGQHTVLDSMYLHTKDRTIAFIASPEVDDPID